MGYFQFYFVLLYSLWQVKLNFCHSFPLIEYTNHLGWLGICELMIQLHQPIYSFLSATSIPRYLSWGLLLTLPVAQRTVGFGLTFSFRGTLNSKVRCFSRTFFLFLLMNGMFRIWHEEEDEIGKHQCLWYIVKVTLLCFSGMDN